MAERSFALQRRGLFVLVVLALLACKKSPKGTSPAEAATAPATSTTPAVQTERYVSERDLERVCMGEPLKEAKAYDGARDRVHPTMVFLSKWNGGSFSKDEDKSWKAWEASENKAYELVLCVTTLQTKTVKSCELETTAGATRTLELQDASYQMVLYEAKTARQIAKKSIDLKVDRKCPTAWLFQHSRAERRPEFAPALVAWAKQYAAPRR